jgi:hypothetical protein
VIRPLAALVTTCALAALVASCGNSSASNAEGGVSPVITEELCSAKCEVALRVVCPDQGTMGECVAACLQDATVCTRQGMAFYQCVVASGSDALVCDDALRLIRLREGFCTQEQLDLNECLQLQNVYPNSRWMSGLASPVTTNQT